jgi:transcriptional regulator with XRE-family HTH domain
MNDFGAWLRENRKAKGLSIRELADALGYAKSCVWSWENGHNEPRLSVAHHAALFFGAPYVLGLERDPDPEAGKGCGPD